MKQAFFTCPRTNHPIAIPVDRITGHIVSPSTVGKTFIATGGDASSDRENGWYVAETFDEVTAIIEAL